MATGRGYRQTDRRQPTKNKKSFPTIWLLLGMFFGAFLLNKPLFSRFISNDNLTAFTSTVLEKNFLPASVILTERISNPVAGNPQVLPPKEADPLDKLAASLDYRGSSVEELAKILTPLASTESEKARLVYAWITQHIGYDVQALQRDRRTLDLSTEGVLSTRMTICSGYANLYQSLAKAMGLKSVIIEGYGKGPSYLVGQDNDINHAWNGVKIDGTWYLLDATWGAGAINNDQFVAKFNPHYFATPPDQLIYSHFPAESQWQLLPTIYTRAEFDQFPDISSRFFRDRLQLLSHKDNRVISANGQSEIRLSIPDNILIAAQLIDKSGSKLDENYTFVQKQGQQAIIRVSFPSVGEYELIIFSKKREEENYYQAVKYDIQAVTAGEAFPVTYASFNDKNAYLEMPLTKSLPVNQASYFQLKVDEASKVIVINKEKNSITELTPSSSFFVGSVVIDPGKTIVAAQFPGSNQYWTLLEYN